MKLLILALSFLTQFVWAQGNVGQVLEIGVLNEAALSGPESIRNFLKTSGYNWENAWRCNRTLVDANELRLSDLKQMPPGSFKITSDLQIEILKLPTFCELNVLKITPQTLQAIGLARLELGQEIRNTLIPELRKNFRKPFQPLIDCQFENESQKRFVRECYETFLSAMRLDNDKISSYLSLLQETALFTLLLDRNPQFKQCPRMNPEQLENWDAAKLISPFHFHSYKDTPCLAY